MLAWSKGPGPDNPCRLVVEQSRRHCAVLPDSIDELRENRVQHVKIEVAVAEKGNARAPLAELAAVHGRW
jgi:hypothetical protein